MNLRVDQPAWFPVRRLTVRTGRVRSAGGTPARLEGRGVQMAPGPGSTYTAALTVRQV